MYRISGNLFFILLLLTFSLYGQELDPNYVPTMGHAAMTSMPQTDPAEDFVVSDVRGNIKATPRFLPKPYYPEEARNAGVEGLVHVKVTIDDQGNVADATIILGDTLLSYVALNAARTSKFRVANDGSKLEGILSYTFEIRKAGWSRIAADLKGLELQTNSSVSIPVILKSLDPAWTTERSMLESLRELSLTQTRRPMFVSSAMPNNVKLPNGMKGTSQTMVVLMPKPNGNVASIGRDLITSLRGRLADDPVAAWQFELGLNVFTAFYATRAVPSPRNPNVSQRGEAAAIINELLRAKPEGVSDDIVSAIQTLETNFRVEKPSRETDNAISAAIVKILSVR